MSGLAGFTGTTYDNAAVIHLMMDKIMHRGPDSSGTFFDDNVTLGFRQLNINYPEHGNQDQPIYNEDKSITLMLNGEIFNSADLKSKLTESGHNFKTKSGAEVLAHLYEEYGTKMFEHIRGMFAFVLYDKNEKLLFAARDFFGIKPMYYAEQNGELILGSEIKSFLPHPEFNKEFNQDALGNYLSFQYSVLPETFFKGVYKLPPGHYLTFKDKTLTISKYFQATFQADENMDMDTAKSAIDAVVQSSIKMHMTGDSEIGSFLSSGVDSSYVAACFKGSKTFTVGFDNDNHDEIGYAASLAEKIGVNNFNKTITSDEYWNILPKVMYYMDEPLADPAAIALYFVSELASKHVKSVLSGEGADEFFGGYNIYKEIIDLRPITRLPKFIRKLLGAIAAAIPFSFKGKNFFIRGSKTVEERFIGNANVFTVKERERILKSPGNQTKPQDITKPFYDMAKNCDDITKMQFIDIHLWMAGDIMLKADKMSMAHSLEIRSPLVDIEVFKVASKIPSKLKVSKSGTKLAFRKAASAYLPSDVALKKKLGFPVPIRNWLREKEYYNKIKDAFLSEASEKYFNVDELVKMLEAHYSGKKDYNRKIWAVYIFLVWYGQYF